jgi:carnitine-CoA ligase
LRDHLPGAINPFAGLDVPWLVALWAQTRPNHLFLIWAPFEGPHTVLTYAQFHA